MNLKKVEAKSSSQTTSPSTVKMARRPIKATITMKKEKRAITTRKRTKKSMTKAVDRKKNTTTRMDTMENTLKVKVAKKELRYTIYEQISNI